MLLHIRDNLPRISLVPASIEFFGDCPKLDNEVAGEVLRLDLTAFLAPKVHQGSFVLPHNNSGVRAADEGAAASRKSIRSVI